MSGHFGAVEADFQSHYGLDLRQALWGAPRTGVRRLLALVKGLPSDSATSRSVNTGGEPWSMQDELLAALVEMVDQSNRMFFSAHAKEGTTVWDPVQIRRPGSRSENKPAEDAGPRKQASASEMRNVFKDNVIYDGGET